MRNITSLKTSHPLALMAFVIALGISQYPATAHAFGKRKHKTPSPIATGGVAVPRRATTDIPATCTGVKDTLNDLLYQAILFRHPDYPAAAGWCSAGISRGYTGFVSTAAEIVKSDEFKTLVAARRTRAEIVGQFYNVLYNRPIDASGYATWVQSTTYDYAYILNQVLTWGTEFKNRYDNIVAGGGIPTVTDPGSGGSGGGPCYHRLNASDERGALVEAATFAKSSRPDLFTDAADRQTAHDMMTVVLNVLRHNGHDVGRAIAHGDLPPTNPYRWGSDALGYKRSNGWEIYDLFGSYPVPGNPQALDEGLGNAEVTDDLIGVGSGSSCD